MASLGSLVVSLSANTASFTSAMDRAAYQSKQRMEQMERQAKIAGAVIGAAMLAGGAAIATQIKRSIDVAEEFERLRLRTEAVLKATGYSAGLTATQIRNFSEEIALSTLASVEGVEAASQKLLTFKSVTGEVFKEAIRLSQDLAAVGFGTLESNVVQLGKALEDPVKGISALREVGVSFTATQKDLIGNFVKTNDVAGAQAVVLEALRTQVGGAGAAEAGGLSGAYDTLGQNVQTFLRNVGDTGPLAAAKTFTDLLAQSVANYNAVLFKSGQAQVDSLVAERQRLLERQERLANIPNVLRLGLGKNDQAKIEAINRQIGALQDLRIQEQIGERAAQQAAQLADVARKKEAEQEQYRGKVAADEKIRAAAAKEGHRAAQRAAEESARAIQRAADEAARAQQRLMDEGQRIMESMRTPSEALVAQIISLNDYLNAGAISWETYSRALLSAQDAYNGTVVAAENAAKAEEDARIRARESLYAGLLSEEEALAMSYVKRYEQIMASTEITETERQDLLRRLREGFDAEQDARENERISTQLQNASSLFDGLAGIAGAAAGKQSALYRSLFAVSKAFAVADAMVKIQQGIASAASLPFPANIAAMASTASAAAGIVSTIQSTQFGGGRALGGPVQAGRSYLVGERGPETITMGANGHVTPNDKLAAPAQAQNIRIINAFDSSVIGDYLGSDSGEHLIMNAVQRNASTVRQIAGGGR